MTYWLLFLKGPIWAFAVWEGRDEPTWCVYADPEIAWMRESTREKVREWLSENQIRNALVRESRKGDGYAWSVPSKIPD